MAVHTHQIFECKSQFSDRVFTLTRYYHDPPSKQRPEYVLKIDSEAKEAFSITFTVSDLTDLWDTIGNEINVPDPPA